MGRVNCHAHAANDDGRCPEVGCHYAAGTACAAWMCPGRKFTNRAPTTREGLGSIPPAKPQPLTAPRSSQQPTLARGCEAEPAARNSSAHRRGDKRKHTTLGMVRKGETFFHHGETCA